MKSEERSGNAANEGQGAISQLGSDGNSELEDSVYPSSRLRDGECGRLEGVRMYCSGDVVETNGDAALRERQETMLWRNYDASEDEEKRKRGVRRETARQC
ncbi:hypothetical protein PHSY_001571 [Pseudozyma hubeiensis SY62]|uniref:Uncharacterized protein n=1 Tax=Pseudozyma hubeiensis (strain SY62) TaxID=1305764 RepID=R9NZ87_PSEHS|nr:hypothetical protein PHSY_001571 [Pseudozyma hubeiensis SY62]GAC94002.1 hypothetical protein PHSY_001571 [Pseudozyma hubeiensis SY62]